MAPCLQMIISVIAKKESNLPISQYGPLGLSTVMFTLELPFHQGGGCLPPVELKSQLVGLESRTQDTQAVAYCGGDEANQSTAVSVNARLALIDLFQSGVA